MSGRSARFAGWAAAISGIAALALLPAAWSLGGRALQWGFAGWSVTTVIGIAGGAWALAWHGRPGSGFLVAFGVCMLARVVALGIGAIAAAARGRDALTAYLAGLLLGYLPTQATEWVWLLRGPGRS